MAELSTRSIQKKAKGSFSQLGLVLALVAMVIAISIAKPVFLKTDNLINVLRQVSMNGILAIGMTLVILTGGIDLSVGSLIAVTGVISGYMLLHGASVFAAVVVSILASVLFGVFNGTMIAYCGLPPFIATLACQTIGRGFALLFSDGKPFAISNKSFLFIGKGSALGIPVPIWVLLVVCVAFAIVLNFTTFGRHIYAFGGNRNATKLSGIKTKFVEMMVYVVSALMSGIAAIILASRISSGQPTAGTGFELDAIAAVAIGGTSMAGGVGRLTGTILGFIIIGVLSNALTLLEVNSFWQPIVKGFIIIGAVLIDMRSKRKE